MEAKIIPGQPVALSDRVVRITASNAGPMTGPGTNTYLVGRDEITVIDPGPNDDSHVEAILAAGAGKIKYIAVTHTHPDHSPAALPLAKATGAPLIGSTIDDDGHQDTTFSADIDLHHGKLLTTSEYTLEAVFTPGHVGNHYCFILQEEQMLFAGDHLMQGSTVVIVPPSGDMHDYVQSLKLLSQYPLQSIVPAHGLLMTDALPVLERTIAHRLAREQKVVVALRKSGDVSVDQLVQQVYSDVAPHLLKLARWSLLAHLLKLEKDNRAQRSGGDQNLPVGELDYTELWRLTE